MAHNNKILKNALFIKGFKILDEKYYLVNTKYYNIDYFLYFYYYIYYYFKKPAVISKKPENKNELFNFYHLNLYNIIQRIFEITKWHF